MQNFGGTLRGFYHEEWRCDYARNGFTNKSIAVAESDDGVTWRKPGYPHNQIILPPPGNTTAAHQTGEGDHGVARTADYLYLFFREWDPPTASGTIGVARSSVADGGRAGTWWKYDAAPSGAWSSPGIGGASSQVPHIPGTAVHFRPASQSFVAVGAAGGWRWDHGFGLGFSTAPETGWWHMDTPLVPTSAMSWDRTPPVSELWAYVSLLPDDAFGAPTAAPAPSVDDYHLFYTYLEPNASFADRLLVRRPVRTTVHGAVLPTHYTSVFDLDVHKLPSGNVWVTSALVPPARGGAIVRPGLFAAFAAPPTNASLAVALWDCYIPEWGDYMVGVDDECSESHIPALRPLGWLLRSNDAHTVPAGFALTPVYRCFDDETKDHTLSTTPGCDFGGTAEFLVGYGVV